MKFPSLFILFIVLLSSAATTVFAEPDGVEVHDAWVREAPPNASVMAAYLTLHNHSDKGRTMVRAESPDFEKVEMHRTEQHEGMTRMVPVSRVMLSPNGSVSFQPRGMHLMLMKPKKRLKSGDSITLSLFFTDKTSMLISLPVKKVAGKDDHSMHDMHTAPLTDSHKDMHSH
ncbi:MAG: copper chaperone PCu(A)C [Ectothiorhodospiraceae bacterium]|nr:copper chaperone PCu(A)C [Ectothiorhodospiraceae bacterium]